MNEATQDVLSTAFVPSSVFRSSAIADKPNGSATISSETPVAGQAVQASLHELSLENDPDAEDDILMKDRPDDEVDTSQCSGLCYDARMRQHAVVNPVDDHPEDPRRILYIYRAIEGAGLVAIRGLVTAGRPMLRRIPVREARKNEVLLVHDLDHWESMLATANMTKEQLLKLGAISDSVYFNQESAYCARLACGGAIETCRAVVEGYVKNAIAVIRPPGHHAEPNLASGFCLFNNVSVAVRVTMQNHSKIKKVLILDWDVHHGNGTQTAFLSDPNVLFISLHRYENANFYPGTTYGNLDQCGEGAGVGRNINIPWPTKGMGDADYLHAFEKTVMPISREFDPDLVISFDAAAGDPIGECFVSPTGYAHMTHQLMELAGGKLVAVLEGGYNLASISASALAVTKTLMGKAPPRLEPCELSSHALATVYRVNLEQSKYWRCMAPMAFSHNPLFITAPRLHDVVRTYQTQKMQRLYKMVELPLLEDRASESFRNQAVCTPDFHSTENLMLVIHDAPELWSNPHPNHNRLRLHESYLPDAAMGYVKWAVEHKFGVIDVNVPAHITDSAEKNLGISAQTARLASYIWDNYLELTDAKDIVLIAVGESCGGLVSMLSTKDVTKRVSAVINIFGRHPLRGLTTIEDSLVDWYYNNSLVFTSMDNEAWNAPKRPKRKFGRAIRGEANEIDELITKTLERTFTFIKDQIGMKDD